MIRTLIALSVVFGLIVADPLPRVASSSPDQKLARSSLDLANYGSFNGYGDFA